MIKYNIQIDGVDKTGKDLLLNYITRLTNHKYVIQSRGLLSQIAYSIIYDRDYKYDISVYEHTIFIYLTANTNDLKVRHSITQEPKIDIERDLEVFNNVVEYYKNLLEIYTFDTSKEAPYSIAKKVINIIEAKENESNV